MPRVCLDMEIRAPAEAVWGAVIDIERYPASMQNVRWVRILDEESASVRRSAWSIVLKGAILEWEERDHLDHGKRVMSFQQVTGDLALFDGAWTVEERDAELTHVALGITFEIGIPLLAANLNPIAQRALHANCTEMLLGVERKVVGA
jgi:ribosome-associated toxin RatA of RatAB toxin-antitoxin module